jgi:hypothetical protein
MLGVTYSVTPYPTVSLLPELLTGDAVAVRVESVDV